MILTNSTSASQQIRIPLWIAQNSQRTDPLMTYVPSKLLHFRVTRNPMNVAQVVNFLESLYANVPIGEFISIIRGK